MTATGASARHTPYLLFILSFSVFALLALATERLAHLTPEAIRVISFFDYLVCAVFFVDFLVCLKRADNRARYLVAGGWFDLLSAVPMADALRLARSARILRIIRLLRALRIARILFRALAVRHAESGLLFAIIVATVFLALSTSLPP